MPQTESKSDVLFERIRADILSLELSPDTPLRLSALSEHYGIGLTPLRECLNRLCSDHLVVPEHNKGFRVPPLTRADLLDLERSRNAIEGDMFVHCVGHADDEWEAGVIGTFHHLSNTSVADLFDSKDKLQVWSRRHAAFHAALIQGADMTWMRRFAEQLNDQLGRYRRFIENGLQELTMTHPEVASLAAQVFSTAMALTPHKSLYEAALSRNQEAARAAFDAHAGLSIAAFESLTRMMPKDTLLVATLGTQMEAVS